MGEFKGGIMKVCISGSRVGISSSLVYNILLTKLPEDATILVGDARGTDEYVKDWCDARIVKVKCTVFKADWDEYGKLAGIIRNKEMIDQANMLIYFRYNKSKGTTNTIDLARAKKIPIYGIDITEKVYYE